MNPRTHAQPNVNNSLMIRQEIQRFESVHPSIYAIYDLIEAIPDVLTQQQIREHVVCIEDSFVNSQEWTLARAVPDLKLGIVGSIQSGKSALVHRYLTGSYMQEESPEGGRFKKELVNDGQSYLLLIRDEGGTPELQFTHWVDAVIFVFSLENEMSFNAIYSYYAKMAHYRNTNEIPLILVGTQDGISETSPRVIDETRARKLANDLRKCAYYETCATYGLNVERVFQDACVKIVQQRHLEASPSNSRSNTPNHSIPRNFLSSQAQKPYDTHSTSSQSSGGSHTPPTAHTLQQQRSSDSVAAFKTPVNSEPKSRSVKESGAQQVPHMQLHVHPGVSAEEQEKERLQRELTPLELTPMVRRKNRQKPSSNVSKSNSFSQREANDKRDYAHFNPNASRLSSSLPNYYKGSTDHEVTPTSTPILSRKSKHKSSFTIRKDKNDKVDVLMKELQIPANSPLTPILTRVNRVRSSLTLDRSSEKTEEATPLNTPTHSRKNRRRSSLFTPSRKEDEVLVAKDVKGKKGDGEVELGSGRAIPIKQGYLYKKSTKGLNKEWKKKYVALTNNGVLSYHPNLHDYMDNTHGKEISLMQTTVKIPGMKPKGSRSPATSANGDAQGKDSLDGSPQKLGGGDDAYVISNDMLGIANGLESTINIAVGTAGTRIQTNAKIETPNVKKRHKRAKSNAKTDSGNMEDSDGYEFTIVSLQNQQWFFEAPSVEDRDDWVTSIENQILCSLQGVMSSKSQANQAKTDPAAVQAIRNTAGNTHCVDCGAQNPDWASLNLGALMCIECSGVHRNLGTHLSRVRSLDLDEWPPELTMVMTSVGNRMANSIWEANLKGRTKPGPTTAREEKERWIRAKYEQKEYLRHLPLQDHSASQQLIDAVARQDVPFLILLLAYAKEEHVNAPYSSRDARTPLHIAAALGNIVLLQLLLWYGANVMSADQEGRTALWFARHCGAQDCVQLLLTNGCPEQGMPAERRPSQTAKTSDVFDKLPASVI